MKQIRKRITGSGSDVQCRLPFEKTGSFTLARMSALHTEWGLDIFLFCAIIEIVQPIRI